MQLVSGALGMIPIVGAIASALILGGFSLALADIYSLCVNWDKKAWTDRYHFNSKARRQQAEFVANVILKYIGRTADDLVQKSSETGPDGKIK